VTPPRKKKGRKGVKPAPDPQSQLPRLRARLVKEQANRDDWHRRLMRTFHAYERRYRLVARLAKRILKLENT
jgi:hypothetical protein